MGIHVPAAIAGLLMIAAPALQDMSPARAQPSPQLTNTQIFSAIAGKVVGAASACNDISPDRVSTAASKAAVMVSVTAGDDADVELAERLFSKNDDYGRELVRSGRIDCGAAEVSLASLEEAETP